MALYVYLKQLILQTKNKEEKMEFAIDALANSYDSAIPRRVEIWDANHAEKQGLSIVATLKIAEGLGVSR